MHVYWLSCRRCRGAQACPTTADPRAPRACLAQASLTSSSTWLATKEVLLAQGAPRSGIWWRTIHD
eukprot:14480752-Alexandrium_andersonii.AAC.1